MPILTGYISILYPHGLTDIPAKRLKTILKRIKSRSSSKELEQTYQLKNDEPKEKVDLKFTAYSKNLKQNLENLFTELNRMDFITNKQMYNDALKLFHVEIRQVQKGHLVFVTDGNGNPVRHPIKMSDFQDRPRFYLAKEKAEIVDQLDSPILDNTVNSKERMQVNSKMLFDLLRLIPSYADKNNFKKKIQLIKRRRTGQRRW